MEKLTGEQIIEKLSKSSLDVYDFAFESIPFLPEDSQAYNELKKTLDWDAIEIKELVEKANVKAATFFKELVGAWSEIAQQGGEGEGENWYSVKYFPDHDVYLKVSGHYYSYDGTHFDGWESVKEVKPQEKTITVYE